jgi:hypothetical protein
VTGRDSPDTCTLPAEMRISRNFIGVRGFRRRTLTGVLALRSQLCTAPRTNTVPAAFALISWKSF